MASKLLAELTEHMQRTGNKKQGRRDGGLGQRIFNEIRRVEGSAKEKEVRAKLAALWKTGRVAWKKTHIKLGQIRDKVSYNRMANPLTVVKINKKDVMHKLSFAPRVNLKAKKLTTKERKFLENQRREGDTAQNADTAVSIAGPSAKTAISLAGDLLTMGSGGQGP